MDNKYGGKCNECGCWVPAGEGERKIVGGHFNPRTRRTEGGTWVTIHPSGDECLLAQAERAGFFSQREAEMPPEHIAVRNALRVVAGQDPDHAGLLNGVGFSGYDSEFGHKLAGLAHYTPRQYEYALKLAWKYRKQLPTVVLEALPQRPVKVAPDQQEVA